MNSGHPKLPRQSLIELIAYPPDMDEEARLSLESVAFAHCFPLTQK